MRIHVEDEGDAKMAEKLAIVELWCIQWHPVDRPSMQMVVQMLEGDQDRLPIVQYLLILLLPQVPQENMLEWVCLLDK